MIDEELLLEIRTIAEDVARSVGEQMPARRRAGFSWETKSTATDVVTEIDTWAEKVIVEAISSSRPDDGFLGEEGTDDPGTTGLRWVIDPVDGTTNLLYDLPGYNVSIGVEFEGAPVAGAVYDPIRSELYSAARGTGATLNGDSISVSGKTDLSSALVATGFNYDSELRRSQAQTLVKVLPAIRDIRRFGGAALDLCAVASGRVDAFFEIGLQPWDACAGSIIAAEAGAFVDVGELTVVATTGIAQSLVDLLDTAG